MSFMKLFSRVKALMVSCYAGLCDATADAGAYNWVAVSVCQGCDKYTNTQIQVKYNCISPAVKCICIITCVFVYLSQAWPHIQSG